MKDVEDESEKEKKVLKSSVYDKEWEMTGIPLKGKQLNES